MELKIEDITFWYGEAMLRIKILEKHIEEMKQLTKSESEE